MTGGVKNWFVLQGQRIVARFPLLQQLAPLGLKYVLVEALIEIPFLLVELSLWLGPLFGFTLGLSLWQRVLLTVGLYALVEGARWAVARLRKRPYRLFGAERDLLRIVLDYLRSKLRREPLSLGEPR